jgi:hypothetical protein
MHWKESEKNQLICQGKKNSGILMSHQPAFQIGLLINCVIVNKFLGLFVCIAILQQFALSQT